MRLRYMSRHFVIGWLVMILNAATQATLMVCHAPRLRLQKTGDNGDEYETQELPLLFKAMNVGPEVTWHYKCDKDW